VSNHLANCGLKRFEHENSPSDDIFRGASSYEEILDWIQSLVPEDRAEVLKFQEHRRSCLPAVLRGEGPGISETEQKEVEGSKDATLESGKHQDKEEQTKNPEAEGKTLDPPKKQNPETEIKTLEPSKKHNPVDTLGKSAK
jgi:hypothetical protein